MKFFFHIANLFFISVSGKFTSVLNLLIGVACFLMCRNVLKYENSVVGLYLFDD